MAFWDRKQTDYDEMDRIIRDNPGIQPAELARRLGVSRSTITRRLPSVEEAGYRYSEDDEGGLWPFKRRPQQTLKVSQTFRVSPEILAAVAGFGRLMCYTVGGCNTVVGRICLSDPDAALSKSALQTSKGRGP